MTEDQVGSVQYKLHRDPSRHHDGEFVITRVETVAICATPTEARQWMLDHEDERRALGEIP